MPVQRPLLIVIAGPNGSGKTTFTEKLLEHYWLKDCQYINPDILAQNSFGNWNSAENVIKAANMAEEIRENCLAGNENMAFETVLSTPGKVLFIKRCLDKGYFVRLFFIGTASPEINAARILRRYEKGGHEVPISKISERYPRSIANCALICPIVDRAYIYDNTQEDAPIPKLIFRTEKGDLKKIYETIPEWAMRIVESMEWMKKVKTF
ncbi:MAG: zeta toxin family protein [Candidatus Adiutrix sp.]|jgi:predicted ABC-type ATPase|nr:zeta toxin family protein [Candidatus Adiutrix sp.]